MKDKKMEETRTVNTISAPGNVISTMKSSASNNDSSCIYGGKNHGVGSIIKNEDGREFTCTDDGTWQISQE